MPNDNNDMPLAIKLEEPPEALEDTEIIFENLSTSGPLPTAEDPLPIYISMLAQSYDTTINMFGRFRQELLQLHHVYAGESSNHL